jgi:hypothetical protein
MAVSGVKLSSFCKPDFFVTKQMVTLMVQTYGSTPGENELRMIMHSSEVKI